MSNKFIKPGVLIWYYHVSNSDTNSNLHYVAKILEVAPNHVVFKGYLSNTIICIRDYHFSVLTKKERNEIINKELDLFYKDFRFLNQEKNYVEINEKLDDKISYYKIIKIDFKKRVLHTKKKYCVCGNKIITCKKSVILPFDTMHADLCWSKHKLKELLWKKFEEDIDFILKKELKKIRKKYAKEAHQGLAIASNEGGELSIAEIKGGELSIS